MCVVTKKLHVLRGSYVNNQSLRVMTWELLLRKRLLDTASIYQLPAFAVLYWPQPERSQDMLDS